MTDANPHDVKLIEHIRASDPLGTASSPSEVEAAAAWTRILALMSSTRRDGRARLMPRTRRRKLLRTSAISVAALVALSGSALAAGDALGIIDLGGGASATQVTTLPVWNATTGTFDSGTANGQYIYELAGVGADVFVCGGSTPYVATFITSSQPLSQSDLESALDPSTPTGLVSLTALRALGITDGPAGCFPESVAGPLGTLQTSSQRAAGEAFQQQVLAQLKGGEPTDARRLAHAPRLRFVTLIHKGKRTIVKLSRSDPGASARAIARASDSK